MKKTFFILVIVLISCSKQSEIETAQGEWIKGTKTEQIKIIEKQFRGFDNVMVETGYRYEQLYWAGKYQNWEHANYQLDKIKVAIENGIIRRPKRAVSATHFLNFVLPKIKKSIETKDAKNFNENFEFLRISCNNCHMMEQVSFFYVITPKNNQSIIK